MSRRRTSRHSRRSMMPNVLLLANSPVPDYGAAEFKQKIFDKSIEIIGLLKEYREQLFSGRGDPGPLLRAIEELGYMRCQIVVLEKTAENVKKLRQPESYKLLTRALRQSAAQFYEVQLGVYATIYEAGWSSRPEVPRNRMIVK